VLVVDDEPAIRRFLRTSLTAHGYQVTEAATARAAESEIARAQPDVIVLDLGLSRTSDNQLNSQNPRLQSLATVLLV
jgi:DNA-binding response OmpR family regulator